MPSNQTPNYALSQWERTDKVLMEDFNADNAKIDAALKSKGDCYMIAKAYGGTGDSGTSAPSQMGFTRQPRFVIIADRSNGKYLFYFDGCYTGYTPAFPGSSVTFSCDYSVQKKYFVLKWYSDTPEHQFNIAGHDYSVIGFYNP